MKPEARNFFWVTKVCTGTKAVGSNEETERIKAMSKDPGVKGQAGFESG